MKSLFLFPFRVIAFFIRMILWIVMIPLIIVFRILGLVVPELTRPLESALFSIIRIFRF